MRQDDVRRECGQLLRVPADIIGFGARPTRVDLHVAADDPARLRKPLLECADEGLKFYIVRHSRQKHADLPHSLALLRPCHHRPRRRAPEPRDELPPSDH
jgi:hypothetical protein